MMEWKYLYNGLLLCLFSGFSLFGMQLEKRKNVKNGKGWMLQKHIRKCKSQLEVVVEKSEQPVECCICFDEKTKQIIPCPTGSQHSDRICNDCLDDCKSRSDLCPICRVSFSFGCVHGKAKAGCDICNEPSSKGLRRFLSKLCIFWSCYK